MKQTAYKIDLKSIAALTPKIEAGAVSKNLDSIIQCVDKAANLGAKIAVLPLNIVLGDIGNGFGGLSGVLSGGGFGGLTGGNLGGGFGSLSGGGLGIVLKKQLDGALDFLSRSVKICCVFADGYDGFTPVVIENGKICHSSTHTTADGVRIRIMQPFFNMNISLDAADKANGGGADFDADIIAVPCSYPAFLSGAERVLPQIAALSKRANATVVCVSNGNGNSASKFVRSADKTIAQSGVIAGYEQSDFIDCLTIKGVGTPVPCPQKSEESWIPPDIDEVIGIVSRGIHARMQSAKASKLVLGLSGGLDSTCSLIFAACTADKYGFDRKNIIAVRMPSKESGQRTSSNGQKLTQLLHVSDMQIPIDVAYRLKRINHAKTDVVYENAQARERAAILLDLANKENALVLGTSDLTEIALGFSTYGGDQLAHFNPNSGLTKLAVRAVVGGYAQKCQNAELKGCLNDILATPYSPELKPNQVSEDILGPYEVFEFFLLRLLAYKEDKQQILDNAAGKFINLSKEQIAEYYQIFIKRLLFGRFKHNFSCDGVAVLPFDLSFFDINSDINPEFLL